jgi:hypothetical protein
MSKIDLYRQRLRQTENWEAFLAQESGLPGPRGNLELAQAVAEEGDQALFDRLRSLDACQAPTNTPGEFLAFCGVLGLGRLLVEGQDVLPALRCHASDPRWRLREAVAMALQRLGRADMSALLQAMGAWAEGNLLERRAAAAALCEPALLAEREHADRVLSLLDRITSSLPAAGERKRSDFQVLRQGLGYCWSVAVAASPALGKQLMEKWFLSPDRDVRWIMRQNLGKKRLARVDREWVEAWQERMRR